VLVSRSLAVALALGASTAAAQAPRPSLVVFDLEAKGATPLQAEAATQGVVRGLRQLDVFHVLSADDVRQLLAIERQRQLLGMEAAGTGEQLTALGARYAVVGTLRATGDKLEGELRLLDTASSKVLSQRPVGPVDGMAALARDLPDLAQVLVGPLLAEQQGMLVVRTREEGAEVLVDDVLLGSTPLSEPLRLSRGGHRLVVRKDGFIAATKPVRIEPEQVTLEEVALVPSPDYAEAWKLRHGRLRVGAYIATASAVGALAGAYLLDRGVEVQYQGEFLPRRYGLSGADLPGAYEADPAAQGFYEECRGEGRQGCLAAMEPLAQSLAVRQWFAMGLLGVGAVATGVSGYLWLTGEDPNRYARLVATVTPGPEPGFVLAGRF
jgi:TolB-like protein